MKNIKIRIYLVVEAASCDDLAVQKYDVFDVFIVDLVILNIASQLFDKIQFKNE